MNKYSFCDTFWQLYDALVMLEDRQDAGQLVDESVYSKARAEFEKHKRDCQECKRPDSPELVVD